MKSSQDLESKLDRHFLHLAMSVNRHLMDHLRRISIELKLDFQTVYIWGTLAQMNLPYTRTVLPSLNPNSSPRKTNESQVFQIVPVRLADLSQVTRLPKETVRRKLEHLRNCGKVDRNDKSEWWITEAGVDEKTYEFTKETIRRFIKVADEIRWILDAP